VLAKFWCCDERVKRPAHEAPQLLSRLAPQRAIAVTKKQSELDCDAVQLELELAILEIA
jgi:hypothetical protein